MFAMAAMAAATTMVLAAATACGSELDDVDEVDASADEAALHTNTDANRIVVYSNNIENMIYDWKDLVHSMAEAPLAPDVFLVQQLSGKADVDELAAFMTRRLGAHYTGIVAQNQPADDRFGNQVHPKPKVTTGIIYRTSRFDVVNRDCGCRSGAGSRASRRRATRARTTRATRRCA